MALTNVYLFWSSGPAVLVQSASLSAQLLTVSPQGPKGPLFWSSGPAALVQLTSIWAATSLKIGDNNSIGLDGAKALAALTQLTSLGIGVRNDIGADGARLWRR